ncbi:DUF3732 domain-containing protein [Streptomyces niveus]|uniref:DUF3732 domain-containing protein n=1 Tax=Streptomyces niveus TaxID=193462 RepID=UPI00365C6C68
MATDLALHQDFVLNSWPVPRFLMLDQPYYPSDMAEQRGRLEKIALDEDRVTVTRLFRTHAPGRQGTVPELPDDR